MNDLETLQAQLEMSNRKVNNLYNEAEKLEEENQGLRKKIRKIVGEDLVDGYFGSITEKSSLWSTYTYVKSVNDKGEIKTINHRFINDGSHVEFFKDISLPDYRTEHEKRISLEEYSAGLVKFYDLLKGETFLRKRLK